MIRDLESRFWSKVNKTDSCWEWMAYRDSFGYGRFRVGKRMERAHRVSYALTFGSLDPSAEVDHMCHNASCVNPSHLRTATRKQNMENRRGAQRNSKSGVRGACWDSSRQKWMAQVRHNGKTIFAGRFDTLAEAGMAAELMRSTLFTYSDYCEEGGEK